MGVNPHAPGPASGHPFTYKRKRKEYDMGIGVSIVLMAIGAILLWAVTASVAGISLNVIGVILLIVGAIGLIIGLVSASSARDPVNTPR